MFGMVRGWLLAAGNKKVRPSRTRVAAMRRREGRLGRRAEELENW
jgi:hypothetical protein